MPTTPGTNRACLTWRAWIQTMLVQASGAVPLRGGYFTLNLLAGSDILDLWPTPGKTEPQFRPRQAEVGQGIGAGGRFLAAGPWMTVPSVLNREPWQGQSQVASAALKPTVQPRCVQVAETAWTSPSASL